MNDSTQRKEPHRSDFGQIKNKSNHDTFKSTLEDFPALFLNGRSKSKPQKTYSKPPISKSVEVQAKNNNFEIVEEPKNLNIENGTIHIKTKTLKSFQPQKNPYKKKRADPISFSLEEAIKVNNDKKKVKSLKGTKVKCQRTILNETLSGNLLDSSNPKRNRGKHREIKKKKLTNLKLLIIKERILKQKFRMQDAVLPQVEDYIDFIDKEEIQEYLKDLEKKKEKKITKVNSKTVEVVPKQMRNATQNELNKDKAEPLEKISDKLLSTSEENSGNKLFSKIREYCDNIVTPELNTVVTEFIKGLVLLQDRAFFRDPIKAKARKRHVCGFKESRKYLTMKKVKMLIIPPDLEKLNMKGSVSDTVKELKTLAESQNVPCVFALNRNRLGKCLKKNVPVSSFSVLNYEGLESRFEEVLHHLENARRLFQCSQEVQNQSTDSTLLSAVQEKLMINEC